MTFLSVIYQSFYIRLYYHLYEQVSIYLSGPPLLFNTVMTTSKSPFSAACGEVKGLGLRLGLGLGLGLMRINLTRQDKTRQDKTGQDKARQGKRQDKVRQEKTLR
jgi:hypothetical protein